MNLSELIHRELARSKEADPRVIARRLVTRIDEQDVREVLADVLADRVRIEIGRTRLQSFQVTNGLRPAPKSRWERHRLALLSQRVCIAGVWKQLGACGADDLDALADEHEQRAREAEAVARRYRDLAERVRAAGATTLADLSANDLQLAA